MPSASQRIARRKEQMPLAPFKQRFDGMSGGRGMELGIALQGDGDEFRRNPIRRVPHEGQNDK
jgi:hypothetical protein